MDWLDALVNADLVRFNEILGVYMTCSHDKAAPVVIRVVAGTKQSLLHACEDCALKAITHVFSILPGGVHSAYMADIVASDGKVLCLRGTWAHAELDSESVNALHYMAGRGTPIPAYTNIEDVAAMACMFRDDELRKSQHEANNAAQREIAENYEKKGSSHAARRGGKAQVPKTEE